MRVHALQLEIPASRQPSRAAAHPAAATPARDTGPLALGRALTHLDRTTGGAPDRPAWNGHRLGATRLPTPLDSPPIPDLVSDEQPPRSGACGGARRGMPDLALHRTGPRDQTQADACSVHDELLVNDLFLS